MDNKFTTVKKLSHEIGLDASNLRRYILKHGFVPVKIRTPESRGQLTLALTQEDAESVKELRRSQGFLISGQKSKPFDNSGGFFYIIQVIPEFSLNRVKLGYTTALEARLSAHRTIAPTAAMLKSWPCKQCWEHAATASITRMGCKHVANEVFDCDDIDALLKRAAGFFDIMPNHKDDS